MGGNSSEVRDVYVVEEVVKYLEEGFVRKGKECE